MDTDRNEKEQGITGQPIIVYPPETKFLLSSLYSIVAKKVTEGIVLNR